MGAARKYLSTTPAVGQQRPAPKICLCPPLPPLAHLSRSPRPLPPILSEPARHIIQQDNTREQHNKAGMAPRMGALPVTKTASPNSISTETLKVTRVKSPLVIFNCVRNYAPAFNSRSNLAPTLYSMTVRIVVPKALLLDQERRGSLLIHELCLPPNVAYDGR